MQSAVEFLKGKSVLIADDDPRNTFALTSFLEGLDMNIVEAVNGLDALNKIAEQPAVDIVLMDMMMPEMDGYEAIARIRENEATTNLPVIAVTAQAMKGDREKCMEAGASDYISKPVNISELVEKMAKALNGRTDER